MIELSLKRIDYAIGRTLGVLFYGHTPVCLTLEDGWKSNKPDVSCIPKGIYLCTRHSGPRYKNTWQINGVPGRSAILFHIGNNEDNTEGCILLGEKFGKLHNKDAVLDSGKAVRHFIDITNDTESFVLAITGEY